MKRIVSLIAAAALAGAALAQTGGERIAHHEAAALTDGEIRRVDKDAKKITIKHGPIQSLDMPAMTMVFQVKDPALLDRVKAGDKVKFAAEKVGGQFTVTRIETAK